MNTSPQKDLSHRRVLSIAVPIVISNATIPILGAVDTGVVGQMGQAAPIGAVGIGAIIISSIYWIFGFLRMGTTGMAAQAIGANDTFETNALLIRALLIGVVAGCVLLAFHSLIFTGAFMIAPTSPAVEEMSRSYLDIRILSAPAAIAIYGITGWLIAHERTGAVLVLQLWMNGVNIILDLWFVLSLGWGVEGVAIATVIAEVSALGLGVWMVRGVLFPALKLDPSKVFEASKMWSMAVVNRDILIRSVFVQAGFTVFLFLSSSFDDVTLAANQVLMQFLFITSYALDGFALAAEALVGQAMGARSYRRFKQSVILTSIWGIVSVLIYAICFYIFGPMIIQLMTTSPDVQGVANIYLPWMIVAPILGVAAWMLDGIFIGATRGQDMRNMMVLSFAIYVASLWVLLPMYGNHGLWGCLMIFFIARGATLGFRFPALVASIR